jgi:hypothetical protein
MRMPFGKHRGEQLADVPSSYLCWCLESCTNLQPFLECAIRDEMARRFGNRPSASDRSTPASLSLCETLGGWYRKMSLRFHPDRGGSDEAMAALNVAREELESVLLTSAKASK